MEREASERYKQSINRRKPLDLALRIISIGSAVMVV